MTNVLGLVTARGGSKGIPRKNVRMVAGKPLIAWTIETARRAQGLSRVVVSTDDTEIADVAREFGAEVPFIRPSNLADDASPHVPVALHALDWFQREERYQPDYVLLLQPTSPLRSADDINGIIDFAIRQNAHSVTSVFQTHDHPYLTRRITETGQLAEFVPCDLAYARRQDLPPAYCLNGALYLIRPGSLKRCGAFVTHDTFAYVMPAERSLQIDTPWDMKLVEMVLGEKAVTDCGER